MLGEPGQRGEGASQSRDALLFCTDKISRHTTLSFRSFIRSASMRTKLSRALTTLACVAWAATAYAQNAQITGAVKDSSGAVIPGATVTARNVETGLSRVAVTDTQ